MLTDSTADEAPACGLVVRHDEVGRDDDRKHC
jgi:hypothetical protein